MGTFDELFLKAMDEESSSSTQYEQSDVQTGKVIGKEDNGYLISVGGKSEMILPNSELVSAINVGDEVEVVLNGMKDGIPQVSQKKAWRFKVLEQIAESAENNTPIKATIAKVITNKEGANAGYGVVFDGDVEGFLPMSHIRAPKEPAELIGKSYEVVVIKYERDRVVVSEKLIREQLQKEYFADFITKHQVGDRFPVVVDSVNDSFALVKAENITMFLHITLFDWKYVKNFNEVLKIGDTFEVVINSIDLVKKSIRVSRKDAIENPMDTFFVAHKIGDDIACKVIRFARGLAILEDENGVEMVLPVGEMSWVNRVSDPKQLLNLGDRVQVRIKDMDKEKQRISTSLKDLAENPWVEAAKTYARDSKHQGKITSITDFGIFIAFEDGIQGLIRKEDIDWNNENINLNDRFKKGEMVNGIVLNIDTAQEKLRLGIKQLSNNPFQTYTDAHPVSSIVTGTVLEVIKDGAIVSLEEDVTGFIHISQLSTEMVNDVKDVCKVGDKIQVAVRRIDNRQQRIELSIRDISQAEEKKALAEIMSTNKPEIPTLGSMFQDILNKKQ